MLAAVILCLALTSCVNIKNWDRHGGENTGEWVLGKSIPLGK